MALLDHASDPAASPPPEPTPIGTGSQPNQLPKSSSDPRHEREVSLTLVQHGNQEALPAHYCASSRYWQEAYIKAHMSVLAVTGKMQAMSSRIENLEDKLSEFLSKAQQDIWYVAQFTPAWPSGLTSQSVLVSSSGDHSPVTPQAVTNELLTLMGPTWCCGPVRLGTARGHKDVGHPDILLCNK